MDDKVSSHGYRLHLAFQGSAMITHDIVYGQIMKIYVKV